MCRPKLVSLEPLLRAFRDQGLGAPQVVLQYIQERAGDEMTEPVAELLTELGSGKLVPVDLQRSRNWDRSVDQSVDRKQFRFIELARNRQLDEALELKQVIVLKTFG